MIHLQDPVLIARMNHKRVDSININPNGSMKFIRCEEIANLELIFQHSKVERVREDLREKQQQESRLRSFGFPFLTNKFHSQPM